MLSKTEKNILIQSRALTQEHGAFTVHSLVKYKSGIALRSGAEYIYKALDKLVTYGLVINNGKFYRATGVTPQDAKLAKAALVLVPKMYEYIALQGDDVIRYEDIDFE